MKKIIISITALCSILTFAGEFTSVPKHRLEGDLGLAFQTNKNTKNKLQVWQRYTKLGITYIPEWNYEINDKIGLTFGPRANVGVGFNLLEEKNGQEANLYGVRGSLGAELDVDFKLPQGEVVYLGFDTNISGIGYINNKWKIEKNGFTTDLGLSLGGKISDKIKLGARVGYELEGLYTKAASTGGEVVQPTNKTTSKLNLNHNLTLGLRFGYLLGK